MTQIVARGAPNTILREIDAVVVIPTLNEGRGVAKTIDELRAALLGFETEIIVVDGRSADGTDGIAKQKGVTVIYQKRKGYGDALRTGFLYASRNFDAKAIVMLDADSSYEPKDIPGMLEPILSDDSDMVVGNRLGFSRKESMSLTNRVGNRILSWFARNLLGLAIHDTQCGLRAFRADLVDEMDLSTDGMAFATEMITDAHFARARITEVPVSYRPRIGETKLNPMRDGLRILGTIIRLVRDTHPLLFFGMSGVAFGVAGLIFGVEVAQEWVRTGTVRRLPTAMLSVLLLVSSTQLLTLGLVADMIKRLKLRVSRRWAR